jgi:hypothetical protein
MFRGRRSSGADSASCLGRTIIHRVAILVLQRDVALGLSRCQGAFAFTIDTRLVVSIMARGAVGNDSRVRVWVVILRSPALLLGPFHVTLRSLALGMLEVGQFLDPCRESMTPVGLAI